MNSPCDGMFSSLVSLSLLISQQIEMAKIKKEMAKMKKKSAQNQKRNK